MNQNALSICAQNGISADVSARIAKSAGFGASFDEIRKAALTRYLTLPFPTESSESWRYTTPDQFDFSLACEVGSATLSVADFATGAALTQPGLTVLSFEQALGQEGALIRRLLGEEYGADLKSDPIAALQLATAGSGVMLKVSRNQQLPNWIKLSQLVSSQAKGYAPIVIVKVESGASLRLIEDLDVAAEFNFARLEFVVEANAQLSFVSLQRLPDSSHYLARHRFHLGRDARCSVVHASLGGAVARVDLDCFMREPGANAQLLSLYLADGARHLDFHTVQHHLAPHCHSDLYSKGVLAGRGRGVYYGYIRVAEDAQKTDAYQRNTNLLLSTEARIDSIPNLEIRANDVKCSHGSSIGQVSPEELFYLMSRGIDRSTAEKLLVQGFIEDILGKIAAIPGGALINERLHALVMERVENKNG